MKGPINPDALIGQVRSLEIFINDCLGLDYKKGRLSGFEYVHDLLTAAVTNSYVETVGEHADSLHSAIKKVTPDRIAEGYTARVRAVGPRFGLGEKEAILAFDHTDEDYRGKLDSPFIHAWTGEDAVTGKWKFLTCAIVNPEGPKVPLLSIPTPVGYDISHQISFINQRIRPLIEDITLSLYDRAFYSKEFMDTLSHLEIPYLIFVPKDPSIRAELKDMDAGDQRARVYDYTYYKNKTKQEGQTTLAFLKQILDKRTDKHYDWVFATNSDSVKLDSIIRTYKQRWRVETGFRVQDEAKIMTRTKEVGIRYFYFAFEQALQFSWGALFKQEAPFKSFLLQLYEASKGRVEREKGKRERRTGQAR